MDVSIIIINYNTCKITCDCIESIYKNTCNVTFEVIVIDNNSTKDNSVSILSANSKIKFIGLKENIGFGKANNVGYKNADGKYILLLNSDTIIGNNSVKIFFDRMERLPKNVACLGTRLKAVDGSYNHSFGQFPTIKSILIDSINLYASLLNLNIKKFNERLYDKFENFEVNYIIGAAIFIRREVIDELGLFDPCFFMYYEETEMQYRYSKNGYVSKIITGPNIIHLESASTEEIGKKYNYWHRRIYFESLFLYMKKRYNKINYILFRLSFLLKLPIFFTKYYSVSEKFKMLKLIFSV